MTSLVMSFLRDDRAYLCHLILFLLIMCLWLLTIYFWGEENQYRILLLCDDSSRDANSRSLQTKTKLELELG